MGIQRIRERKNLSRAELAKKAGVTRQTIYNLESGVTSNARIRTLQKIAKAMNVSMNAIFSAESD